MPHTSKETKSKALNQKTNQQVRCDGDVKSGCKCNKRLFDLVNETIEIVCPRCGVKMTYTLTPVVEFQ